MTNGANWGVIAELAGRIDSVDARTIRASTRDLVADLDAIRRIAAANGFAPVLPIIQAIERSLAQGERGPAVAGRLTLLRDAVRCGQMDSRTSATFAAACAVRFAD